MAVLPPTVVVGPPVVLWIAGETSVAAALFGAGTLVSFYWLPPGLLWAKDMVFTALFVGLAGELANSVERDRAFSALPLVLAVALLVLVVALRREHLSRAPARDSPR